MNLGAIWAAAAQQRLSEAATGTLGRNRLWWRLDGDPYSYNLRAADPSHFRIKLNPWKVDIGDTPEGEAVKLYVTTMIPDLDPFDWWWTKGNDDKIEVCIRMAKVLEIAG